MISAIVPIKRESQRVPNKNFRTINNKPLFFWIITTLHSSEYIDEIVINCDEIFVEEQLNEHFDFLKFVYRPIELIGNEISMNKIIEYTIPYCKNDSIIQTHTTNPLLSVDTINDVIEKHLQLKSDFFSVTSLQERLYDQKGNAINHKTSELIQTQDLEKLYIENSGFYVFTKENFKNNDGRVSSHSTFYETTFPENIDIDNEYDFQIADLVLKNLL